jgi:hypothetical protein
MERSQMSRRSEGGCAGFLVFAASGSQSGMNGRKSSLDGVMERTSS